jgi:ribosome-associated heat shock protein Hsp15
MDDQRIDKWLWAARFFKTRSIAQAAVESGKVMLGGERPKSARAVHVGDRIEVRAGEQTYEVIVRGLSGMRGPAPFARTLYDETPESLKRRLEVIELNRQAREPAREIKGRPTKQDRRLLDSWRDQS